MKYDYTGYNRNASLEKETQRKVLEWLSQRPHLLYWRVVPFNGRGSTKHLRRGLPDIFVVYRHNFVALEIKREGAKLRPEQEKFKEDFEKEGGIYKVISNLNEILDIPELSQGTLL